MEKVNKSCDSLTFSVFSYYFLLYRGKARSNRSKKNASAKPTPQHAAETSTSPKPLYWIGTMTSVEAATMPKIPWKATA